MGKIYDLTSKLSEEKPQIKIGDDTFTINDSLKTMFDLDAVSEQQDKGEISTVDFLKKFFAIALGDEGAKVIEERQYRVNVCMAIMEAIKDALSSSNSEADNSQNA